MQSVCTDRVNKTVQHDANLALGRFKHYESTLAQDLSKKLPKPSNKFPLNTVNPQINFP